MTEQGLQKVEYTTPTGQDIKLTLSDVKHYLNKGKSEITDKEAINFLQLCQAQKLNPFTNEAYLIKYKDDASMVVGYVTFVRRAEENPEHLRTESGIVVQRGKEIVKREGSCIYPTETLLGGWCREIKIKHGREVPTYAEVSLAEYNQHNAIWNTKPGTMIRKVAISQCLREAYPKDFNGIYTAEEMPAGEEVHFQAESKSNRQASDINASAVIIEDKDGNAVQAIYPSDDDRRQMFKKAHKEFGKADGDAVVRMICDNHGIESTAKAPVDMFEQMNAELDEAIQDKDETLKKLHKKDEPPKMSKEEKDKIAKQILEDFENGNTEGYNAVVCKPVEYTEAEQTSTDTSDIEVIG